MDVAIQQPWFKRALGPFYPSRLFDQFFGEGLFEYDLLPFLSSTISPYYRQSLFRTVLDSGISEVRPPGGEAGVAGGPAGVSEGCARQLSSRLLEGRCRLQGRSPSPQFLPTEAGGVLTAGPPVSPGGVGGGSPPEPDGCLFLHQLMTRMWFVMHQPHAGGPKNSPTKASPTAGASCVCRAVLLPFQQEPGGGVPKASYLRRSAASRDEECGLIPRLPRCSGPGEREGNGSRGSS